MKYVYKFIMQDGITFDAGSDEDADAFRARFKEAQHSSDLFYLEARDQSGRLVTFDFRPKAVIGLAIIPQETIKEAQTGPLLHRPN